MDIAPHHTMTAEQQTLSEALFVCPQGPRRLVLNVAEGRLTVIDQGDSSALHSGATSPLLSMRSAVAHSV